MAVVPAMTAAVLLDVSANDATLTKAIWKSFCEFASSVWKGAEWAKKRRQQTGTKTKYWLPPRRRTFASHTKVLYHLTNSGQAIKQSGEMRRGSSGLVGGGIYFADSAEVCKQKAHTTGWLITARVLVGKAKVVDMSGFKSLTALLNQYSFQSLQSEGYDSIRVSGLKTGEEYIVYNKDQVELVSVEKDSGCSVM